MRGVVFAILFVGIAVLGSAMDSTKKEAQIGNAVLLFLALALSVTFAMMGL